MAGNRRDSEESEGCLIDSNASYRPPLNTICPGADKGVLRRVASTTGQCSQTWTNSAVIYTSIINPVLKQYGAIWCIRYVRCTKRAIHQSSLSRVGLPIRLPTVESSTMPVMIFILMIFSGTFICARISCSCTVCHQCAAQALLTNKPFRTRARRAIASVYVRILSGLQRRSTTAGDAVGSRPISFRSQAL